MTIYFITGNDGKFKEVKSVIPEIERLKIDLPEVQDIDPRKVIEDKLMGAFKHKKGEFIVEDTSLFFDCLNGFPGPFIKWFIKSIGREGLFDIVEKMGNDKAVAKTTIGYARSDNDIHFFEGTIEGKIVYPRGESGFGWDSIFQPEGFEKTFAEMSHKEKNLISMRRVAINKLKDFLDKSG